jgi:hypothetical protein
LRERHLDRRSVPSLRRRATEFAFEFDCTVRRAAVFDAGVEESVASRPDERTSSSKKFARVLGESE